MTENINVFLDEVRKILKAHESEDPDILLTRWADSEIAMLVCIIDTLTSQLAAERRAVERLIEFGVRANHVDDRPCLAAPCTKNGVMPSCTDCLRDYAYAEDKNEVTI